MLTGSDNSRSTCYHSSPTRSLHCLPMKEKSPSSTSRKFSN